MDNKFAYANEEDKCYGLAGIAISLNVWDKHDIVREFSLDGDESVSFAPSFFVCANPRMSAKIAWNDLLQHYKMLMGMTISNIMCRSVVLRRRPIDRSAREQIYEIVEEEGREACSLDSDETMAMFSQTFDYFSSIYLNRQIAPIVRQFVATLAQRRTLSGAEIEEELQRCLRR